MTSEAPRSLSPRAGVPSVPSDAQPLGCRSRTEPIVPDGVARRRGIHVLHVTWRLSRSGGIPIVIRALATGLAGVGTTIDVATVRPALPEDGHAEIVGLGKVHPLDHRGRYSALGVLLLGARLARLSGRLRPDVIHAHSGTALVTGLAAMITPSAGRILDVHDAPGNARHSRLTEAAEGYLCRRRGYVAVVHSRSVERQVRSQWSLPQGATRVIPLGVDTGVFADASGARDRWRAEEGISGEDVVVLYVARLVLSKNVALLVDAADRLRRQGTACTVVVLSEGPERANLQRRIDECGLTDTFRLIGARPSAGLVAALGGADIFCSTSDYEGFGLGVAEAMAAGLPVVATAVGGVTDLVVEGETGYLVSVGDTDAVADALARLIADPRERQAMGDAGRRRALERFDVRSMVDHYRALYEELTA